MRKRSRTRQARRLRAPKPPIQAARTYADALGRWMAGFQAWQLERLKSTWHENLHHNPYPGHRTRTDARPPPPVVPKPLGDWIDQRIGEFHLALGERFAPETELSRTLKVVAARVNKKGGLEFQRTIGIPTKAVAPSGAIEAWRTKNTDLITSLAEREIEELRPLLETAEAEAWSVETLSEEIQIQFGVSQSKADLLARDQTLKLKGQLNQERQMLAGITEYIWTTSGDERVRETHAELDGTTQSWLAPPVMNEDGDTGHPGEDYQCRCTADPILSEIDDVIPTE